VLSVLLFTDSDCTLHLGIFKLFLLPQGRCHWCGHHSPSSN